MSEQKIKYSMNPNLIIAAIIRLISLKYALAGLMFCTSLPAHISMLSRLMSESVKSVGQTGLVSDAMNIGYNLGVGVILWVFAKGIANLILKTLERNNTPS
jgi:hypothetical protein